MVDHSRRRDDESIIPKPGTQLACALQIWDWTRVCITWGSTKPGTTATSFLLTHDSRKDCHSNPAYAASGFPRPMEKKIIANPGNLVGGNKHERSKEGIGFFPKKVLHPQGADGHVTCRIISCLLSSRPNVSRSPSSMKVYRLYDRPDQSWIIYPTVDVRRYTYSTRMPSTPNRNNYESCTPLLVLL